MVGMYSQWNEEWFYQHHGIFRTLQSTQGIPIYWPAKMIMLFPKLPGSFGIKKGSEPSTKMAWSCSRWEFLCEKRPFDLIGHLQSTTKELLRFARSY